MFGRLAFGMDYAKRWLWYARGRRYTLGNLVSTISPSSPVAALRDLPLPLAFPATFDSYYASASRQGAPFLGGGGPSTESADSMSS